MPYDIAIIGAGVVGCAVARRFALSGARTVILEKAPDVLDGASKGNSAILHTGFDAPPGSLEQACVARGYYAYLRVAQECDLPVLKAGALVLAWDSDQEKALPALIAKAKQNGVHDVAMVSKSEILRREPHLSASVVAGFEVPGEYVIDPWTSAHAYLLQAMANGARLMRKTEVTGGTFAAGTWSLHTNAGEVRATQVINCAGLYGDIVDARLTGKSTFQITPRKGQFVVFDKFAAKLNGAIILPVPTKTTKGIVICRTIFGNLLVGPTAEDQISRTDATTERDTLRMLCEKGAQMIPALADCEMTTAYAGLRPATQFQDFQINYTPENNYTCVGGIRSTGLSAALGIADHVADLLQGDIGISEPVADPVLPRLDRLSDYHRRDWQEPGHGGIVCHCELVTRREIEQVLSGPLAPQTLQGLKRRTRACMGRCQGFYCMAEVTSMLENHAELNADGSDETV